MGIMDDIVKHFGVNMVVAGWLPASVFYIILIFSKWPIIVNAFPLLKEPTVFLTLFLIISIITGYFIYFIGMPILFIYNFIYTRLPAKWHINVSIQGNARNATITFDTLFRNSIFPALLLAICIPDCLFVFLLFAFAMFMLAFASYIIRGGP